MARAGQDDDPLETILSMRMDIGAITETGEFSGFNG